MPLARIAAVRVVGTKRSLIFDILGKYKATTSQYRGSLHASLGRHLSGAKAETSVVSIGRCDVSAMKGTTTCRTGPPAEIFFFHHHRMTSIGKSARNVYAQRLNIPPTPATYP